MASLFTKILAGEIPGRVVWKDERAFAILTIKPIRAGHTLVIPRQEVDHWIDLDPVLLHHVSDVAQSIGKAIQDEFQPTKVGVMVAGLEVRHVHFHLVPIHGLDDLDFKKQQDASAQELDAAAERIRGALRRLGYGAKVPG